MTTDSLNRATLALRQPDLQHMVLEKGDLPQSFAGYEVARESGLDNEMMAQHGFPGSTAERFRQAGRIDGYMREFGVNASTASGEDDGFMAATVAHLFDTSESVYSWMHDVFLKEFQDNIGKNIGMSQQLVAAEPLKPEGFFDESVGLKAVHDDDGRVITVTIVDFRVGRILGVAFVGVLGDVARLDLATELGIALEKRIVSVALGTNQ